MAIIKDPLIGDAMKFHVIYEQDPDGKGPNIPVTLYNAQCFEREQVQQVVDKYNKENPNSISCVIYDLEITRFFELFSGF